jgi:hypothetical protein
MDSSSKFTVIIGDISRSKMLSGMDRYQTQLFVKSAIVQINEQYQENIEAPMTITKGDEFQGLVSLPSAAFQIVQALQKMVFPIQIRYGLGIGHIYKMGGILPIEMDGPAFHRANRALMCAKKRKSNLWLISDDEVTDQLINTIFHLITAIKSRWNERHHKLYWSYQELGTYREVALIENVTPQAVCDVLKNSRAVEVIGAEKKLLQIFDQCFRNKNSVV